MAINIPEPCHENWSKMTPTQRGAFCSACSKEVIDFTDKSATEIKSIFAKEFAENRSPCARITNYQLNQINDDYFRWKNDTEAFRAVWVFSMLAVFGLSLFSCQNTATKELVNQMQIESSQLLDSLKNEDLIAKDSMNGDVQSKNTDSLAVRLMDLPYTLGGVPMELPQVYGGTSPWMPNIIFTMPWITVCEPWGSDLLGVIAVEPATKKSLIEHWETALTQNTQPLVSTPVPKMPAPHTPKTVQANTDAVLNSGNKKFSAFIYPNPIEPESKLYLDLAEFLDLHLIIHAKNDSKTLLQLSTSLAFGLYVLEPDFHQLSPGEYQLRIESNSQISVLDFVVPQTS